MLIIDDITKVDKLTIKKQLLGLINKYQKDVIDIRN